MQQTPGTGVNSVLGRWDPTTCCPTYSLPVFVDWSAVLVWWMVMINTEWLRLDVSFILPNTRGHVGVSTTSSNACSAHAATHFVAATERFEAPLRMTS